jgi:hypothetical protein
MGHQFIRKQGGGGCELLALLGGESVEFGVGFAADGAHGGALGVAAFGFGFDLGFDRLEIDKPAFENGLRHLFEGLVDLAVEFDFVVKVAEDAGNGALGGRIWDSYWYRVDKISI